MQHRQPLPAGHRPATHSPGVAEVVVPHVLLLEVGLAVLLLGVSAAAGYQATSLSFSAEAWLSALASGALYYAAAFWLYLTGLRRINAATAGLYINLIPVFGIAASYVLLGERLSARQWLGAILIVTTMFVVIRSQSVVSSATQTLDV
jgi:drug/metabolite transporter (DMT)-like permease